MVCINWDGNGPHRRKGLDRSQTGWQLEPKSALHQLERNYSCIQNYRNGQQRNNTNNKKGTRLGSTTTIIDTNRV